MTSLNSELLSFMALSDVDEAIFNGMALRLFAHQFENNLPFQKFCQQRDKTLRNVKSWRDIPAVPINGFKDLTLSCVAPERCERIFMTSGTTRGEVKGRHYHPNLEVYDASMRRNFAQSFMQGTEHLRMGVLFPTPLAMPNSSLAHYLDLALRHFGTPESENFMGEQGVDVPRLMAVLQACEQSGEPIALLGASFSFVQVMDALAERGVRFSLPKGSRLLDTGGFKGQSRELALEDFYAQLGHAFGVNAQQCINMYGMTELSTQFYDRGNAQLPSVKRGPHWIRSRVIEPMSGLEMAAGERGILVHCDLANYNAVTTILTEDVGVMQDDGFLLLGRAQGAQAKGCSLAVEEFLKAASA